MGGWTGSEEFVSLFVAASDETAPGDMRDDGTCIYGGYVASKANWDKFNIEWTKWVLSWIPTPPGYFHMSEMRNPRKQIEWGISRIKADRNIEFAHKVIREMSGVLRPVVARMSTLPFSPQRGAQGALGRVAHLRFKRPERRPAKVEPDHVGFYRYVRTVADLITDLHPECTRINFMIECKSRELTRDFEDIFDLVRREFVSEDRQRMADLLGCVYAEHKNRPPLQAADFAIWHIRKAMDAKKGTNTGLTPKEQKRAIKSLKGLGKHWDMNDAAVQENAERLVAVADAQAANKKPGKSRGACPDPSDAI